jgi:glycosyltransferase involved in cell wall biosynthesis
MNTLNNTLSKIKIKKEHDIKRIYSINESNLDKYDNIITVNPAFTSILKNKYPNKNIYYIPNCIGANNLYYIPNKCNNISKINYLGKEYDYNLKILDNLISSINPNIKFIYIGRIEEYKNIINLIEVFKSIENCSLILIGSNTENININHNNIIYIDHLCNEECMKIMKMNDVLVNISLTESFPMIILEAGLNKLCCYISDLPGLKTIFEDCCIYSLNHYDQNIIKKDLLNIINNKNIIYEYGNKLYNLIKKNYNTDYYHQYLYQLQLYIN